MGLAKNVIIIERGLWATIARGIFGAGSGFRVGWGTAWAGGGLVSVFLQFFCWYWRNFYFGGWNGAGLSFYGV